MENSNPEQSFCVKVGPDVVLFLPNKPTQQLFLHGFTSEERFISLSETSSEISAEITYIRVRLNKEQNREVRTPLLEFRLSNVISNEQFSQVFEIKSALRLSEQEAITFTSWLQQLDINSEHAYWKLLTDHPAYAGKLYAVDKGAIHQNQLFVHGWLENASREKIHVISSDLTSYITPPSVFFRERADVSEVLKDQSRASTTSSHGFSFNLPLASARHDQTYLLFIEKSGQLLQVGAYSPDFTAENQLTPSFFWQAHSRAGMPELDFIEQIIRPLLENESIEQHFSTLELGPMVSQIETSVVVPLFGDWFFLRSLTVMQNHLPENFEWIFVCDDPTIALEVINYLSSRSSSIKRRTRLVVNESNYGYSASNNIGVSVSTGEYILFMNSDIWMDSSDGLLLALDHLRDERFHLLGFRLLFEDGSLQHDGMSFERNSAYHNLFLAEHRDKGLPPQKVTESVTNCDAVTGALLLVRRSHFEALGGFDPSYIKGDFEDADLCLKFKRSGKSVGIVQSCTIYHLERQSIRQISSSDYRQAITLCNCLTFNRRWSEFLASSTN